jgi:hypothetical protein
MARVLPNSKQNPRKVSADSAYNRAVNRGDLAAFLDAPVAAQIQDEAKPKRLTGDLGGTAPSATE